MINVVQKLCQAPNCNKTASCNIKDILEPIFCADHRTENMINVVHKLCQESGCNKLPIYNVPDKKVESTVKHIRKIIW